MMLKKISAAIAACLAAAAMAQAGEPYAPMAPFAALDGRTVIGEGNGPDGKPVVDVAHYEMILGGRALQTTHRLKNHDYGGRAIIFYDEGAKTDVYHYFTSAGFHTIGEIKLVDGGFEAVEAVQNHPEFTEVRSIVTFDGDDIVVRSKHLKKDGAWSGGEELVYRGASDEVVAFD